MQTVEIHFNRRGINSIEVPREMSVESGSPLVCKLINHGTPIHITLASNNSALFSDFYHENLYIEDVVEYTIPINDILHEGFFDLDVITGYGTKKGTFRVFVKRPQEKEKTVEDEPVAIKKASPPRRFPWLLIIVLISAALCFGAWIEYGIDLLNFVAFALILVGVVLAWSFRR